MRLRHWSSSCMFTLLAVLIGCGTPSEVQPGPGTPEHKPTTLSAPSFAVLFVGNSHTSVHDMPDLVRRMILFQFPGAKVEVRYFPVAFLEDVASSPDCSKALASRHWSHVVLQAQKVSMSGKYEYSKKEGIALAKEAKEQKAAVIFFPEWGLQGIPDDGDRQTRVYQDMAEPAGASVAPVAHAWDLALAARPDLRLHAVDGNHQSALGAFLTACVLTQAITGRDATSLGSFADGGLSDTDRKFLAAIAARAAASPAPK